MEVIENTTLNRQAGEDSGEFQAPLMAIMFYADKYHPADDVMGYRRGVNKA